MYNEGMKKGLLIVYSGPSGVGKGTVLNKLMPQEDLNLAYSVSMTTRKPREGEVDGVNYFFVSHERFLEAIKNNELLEHARFVDNDYGTPKAYVEEQRNLGKNIILEIEVEGAKQIIKKCPDCISIFLVPPSLEELENRIRGRQTDDDETILKRLSKARHEIKETELYKYIVCNKDIEQTANEIRNIILKEMAD